MQNWYLCRIVGETPADFKSYFYYLIIMNLAKIKSGVYYFMFSQFDAKSQVFSVSLLCWMERKPVGSDVHAKHRNQVLARNKDSTECPTMQEIRRAPVLMFWTRYWSRHALQNECRHGRMTTPSVESFPESPSEEKQTPHSFSCFIPLIFWVGYSIWTYKSCIKVDGILIWILMVWKILMKWSVLLVTINYY